MALFYREIQDNRPDKDGNRLWRPILVRIKKMIKTRELGKFIAAECSMTEADVVAVILSLTRVMGIQLMNGNSVRLEGLGTFTIYSRSKGKGVVKKEDVNPNQISSLICKFTPEYTRTPFQGVTRSLFEGAQFMHVNQLHHSLTTDNGENEGGNDDGGYVDPTG